MPIILHFEYILDQRTFYGAVADNQVAPSKKDISVSGGRKRFHWVTPAATSAVLSKETNIQPLASLLWSRCEREMVNSQNMIVCSGKCQPYLCFLSAQLRPMPA